MIIDEITNGIVLDHISAGMCMEIYRILHLERLECSVAIIKNVSSRKMGKKDIIKVADMFDLDLDVLGYIDPNITVNIIKDGKLFEKRKLALPDEVRNVIACKNPRCITSTEQELPQIFRLTDRENRIYRCVYCESRAKDK
ncbi:MAG: aspartate carbamoyltransferase regulatory subunit [Clostridiales bacterium]|jgi:aspartate carbamoyltransferase regulatory subunit|nr:aspartate carbamoyltransferase regulatory subunit [Clostridiales bacterium]